MSHVTAYREAEGLQHEPQLHRRQRVLARGLAPRLGVVVLLLRHAAVGRGMRGAPLHNSRTRA